MKTLVKGTNSDAIYKLIKVLINMQQDDFKEAIAADTKQINDVCSQISTNRELFGQSELGDAVNFLQGSPESPRDPEGMGGGHGNSVQYAQIES